MPFGGRGGPETRLEPRYKEGSDKGLVLDPCAAVEVVEQLVKHVPSEPNEEGEAHRRSRRSSRIRSVFVWPRHIRMSETQIRKSHLLAHPSLL